MMGLIALMRGEGRIDRRDPRLEEACARISLLFARSESRSRAIDYVEGLLSGVARKNSWQVAAHAGHATPDGIQWLLSRAPWSADALRDITRNYVLEKLGDERAVVVLDEIAFPKRGDKSVGVARQRVGPERRVENCQVGVFMAYVSPKGTAIIDRELYLPHPEWSQNSARCRAAGVPDHVRHASKAQLARRMLARALTAKVPLSAVVVGGSCSGAPVREYLAAQRLTSVEEISGRHPVVELAAGGPVDADTLARLIPQSAFEQGYPAGGSAATLRLGLAGADGLLASLLVRTGDEPADLRYFLCHAPRWAPLGSLVTTADTHALARQYIARGRIEAGLDHYEVRKWEPWYRHVTLSLFAMAYLAVSRAEGVRTEHLERAGLCGPTRERAHRPGWRSRGYWMSPAIHSAPKTP